MVPSARFLHFLGPRFLVIAAMASGVGSCGPDAESPVTTNEPTHAPVEVSKSDDDPAPTAEWPKFVRISTPDFKLGFSIQVCDGTYDEMALRPYGPGGAYGRVVPIDNRIELYPGQYLGATVSSSFVEGGVTDENVRLLTEIPHLEAVVIGDHQLSATGWYRLGEIPGLRKLAVGSPQKAVTRTDDLVFLRRLRNLEYLDIRGRLINEDVMAALATLPALQELRVSFPRSQDNSKLAVHLTRMPQLRRLVAASWTDTGWVEVLPKLTQLEELDVQFQRLSDSFVRAAATLPHLRHLRLRWGSGESGQPGISGEAFGSLGALPQLEELEITGAFLHHPGMFEVFSGRPLKRLFLGNCQLPANLAEELRNLRELRCLEIVACEQITDEGLWRLAELPSIRELSVSGCPNVTEKWLEGIPREGPPLTVQTWFVPGGPGPSLSDYKRAAEANPRIRLRAH